MPGSEYAIWLSDTTLEHINDIFRIPRLPVPYTQPPSTASLSRNTLVHITDEVLQLSVRGLDSLVLVLGLLDQLLIAAPVHSPETFGQDRVRVVKG